jgi:basic membrane protein A
MKMKLKMLFTSALLSLGLIGAALAEPALIYDMGGKFDKSFNEMAYMGAERWKKETGGSYRDIEIQSETQREQALRRFAEAGKNPIIVTGFSYSAALSEVADDYPDTKFAIIDGYVPKDNVLNIGFAEHEGSYLVGMMAAMASKTGTVGFIGGMDIPLISKFGCGYAQGAKAVNANIKVIQNMTGPTPAAWNDPVKGAELTKAQISQSADVVYAAAGGTGVGVLQAAADADILSIGVDANQNYIHPGKVLTSMVKRVDVAVFDSFSAGENLEMGFSAMGLANEGVGYAMDSNNASLVSADMVSALEKARAQIIAGSIKVHDYTTDNACPAN